MARGVVAAEQAAAGQERQEAGGSLGRGRGAQAAEGPPREMATEAGAEWRERARGLLPAAGAAAAGAG